MSHEHTVIAVIERDMQQHDVYESFAQDPFGTLAEQSRMMFDTYHDPSATDVEKDLRLEQYFSGIEALDRATFPETNGVQSGVPDGYIPHGFTDMGSESELDPSKRSGRAMNYVDTRNILHQHKNLFKFVFSNIDPNDFENGVQDIRYQQAVLTYVASEISDTMPYGWPAPSEPGGMLPISEVDNAVCQQHALTAQVLMQAFGIRSRLSKNTFLSAQDIQQWGMDVDGGDHVSNVVTLNRDGKDATYMFDPTNP